VAAVNADVIICDEIGMLQSRVVECTEEVVRQLASGPEGPVRPRSGRDVAWFAGKSVLFFGDPEQLLAVTEDRTPQEVAGAQVFTQQWLQEGFTPIELTQCMRAADPDEQELRDVIADIRRCRDGDDLQPSSLDFLRRTLIPAESVKEQEIAAVRLALGTENSMIIC
jgi:hypothetical protein